MITAPFNFVPLSNKVYFPEWAKDISHDIPFEDGVSGVIRFKITAQTPIFVRNGHSKKDAENKNSRYKSFSKTPDNHYFLPSTTLKGCLRSAMEILSFAKMSQVENSSFGMRDLNNKGYRDLMSKNHCGWMSYNPVSNTYQIRDCGEPKKISIKEIDSFLKTNILFNFIKDNDFKDDNDRLALAKYKMIYTHVTNSSVKSKEDFDDFLNSNSYLLKIPGIGTYVLSGQSSRRKYDDKAKKPKVGKDGVKFCCWKGKEKEFIFPEKAGAPVRLVSTEVFSAFETIHKSSLDYVNFWKKKLNKGQEIPVFFNIRNNEIVSIGLSFLFKSPCSKSVFDAIPEELKNGNDFKMDLSDCIFGHTNGNDALRGRVQVGHAFAMGQVTPMQENVFVSATPHPSYYPLYVENGNDWNHACKIAGRKRYPVRNDVNNVRPEGTDDMKQVCCMLGKGVQFAASISFHNLKEVELGALLSTITFHGNSDKCYHNLGFGKALGYGKIKISDLILSETGKTAEDYMEIFENTMNAFVNKIDSDSGNSKFSVLQGLSDGKKWLSSIEIQEFMAMSIGIPQNMLKNFKYMRMSTNRNENEFLQVRNNKEYLERFTKITHVDGTLDSIKGKHIMSKEEPKEEKIQEVIKPTDLKEGDVVEAKCIKAKVVRIDGYEYDIQLVVDPGTPDKSGKMVKVVIKQISKKTGKICQVGLAE